MTPEELQRRLTQQRDLEDLSGTLGTRRYLRTLEGAERGQRGSVVGATRILLQEVVEPLAKAFIHKHEEYRTKKGRTPPALAYIHPEWDAKGESHPDKLGADTMAYLTARAVLDSISRDADLKEVSRRLMQLVTHELSFRKFQRLAPSLFNYRIDKMASPSYGYQARKLGQSMSVAKCDACREDPSLGAQEACPHMGTAEYQFSGPEALKIGTWMIDMMIQATGLIEIDRRQVKHKGRKIQKNYVVPTEETRDWLDARDSFLAGLRPVRMPMVVPPVPWTKGDDGGYRFALRGLFPMVRTAGRPHIETRGMELPKVRKALNLMQETAWEINLDARKLLTMIEEAGGGVAGVPLMDDPPPPSWEEMLPKIQRGDLGDVGPQFRVVYKGEFVELYEIPQLDECRVVQGKLMAPNKHLFRTVDAIYAENRARWKARKHQQQSDRATYFRMMGVANRMASEPEIYFPYSLDFRGRIYPLPDYLTPQGTDMEKGLLSFSRKDPMGPDGGDWLALHIMNCIGETPEGVKVSRMTRSDRIDWVDDHLEDLVRYVKFPLGAGRWGLQTEEPVQLYAAACEWIRFASVGFSEDYLCGIPVGQDGTCNGLQHFAAMLRDPVAAEAVNVSNREFPQDVYERIAAAVLAFVERDHTHPMAKLWLSFDRPLIDRKRCKRPTMTFPYGSAVFGFTDQLIEEIQKEEDWPHIERHFGPDLLPACRYLANAIWDALDEVVDSAKQAMEWIQKCARIIGKERPLEWRVPGTGFPVMQGYMECDRVRVNTILASGVRIRTDWYEQTEKPKLHRQVNASSPNVVHSLDAAHLQMTVVEAHRQGIRSFGMVHDSYATTPGRSYLLSKVLREEFHTLYSDDVLHDLWDQWLQLTDEELPQPPRLGSFQLGEVLFSIYFFS